MKELTQVDKFMILASDGVWEFIESQDAVDIVGNCETVEEGCRQVNSCNNTLWNSVHAEIAGHRLLVYQSCLLWVCVSSLTDLLSVLLMSLVDFHVDFQICRFICAVMCCSWWMRPTRGGWLRRRV